MDKERFTYHAEILRSSIVAFATKLCGNREDAEDVAQDTLLKMWSMRDNLDRYSSPEALAITICRNRCIDILKKRGCDPLDETAASRLMTDASADAMLLADEEKKEADKILSYLPEPQQLLLKMRHVEGMDIGTIAEVLCTTEANVRTMLCRARQKVMVLFKQSSLK
ncbi:MAG: sigma-70 family RNA polymerase sigma factor [Muribaculaceae bacterium]|nr:sigma-70 family RNA polymerase sigma factor [Muribaculaceae bacterium]